MKRFDLPTCLSEALRHSLLSHEETCSLALRAQRGDDAALASIISHNQRLVFSVAAYYTRFARTHDILDLMQEGNIGFMKAIRKFDPSRGFKLSTYAMKFIRFAIIGALNDTDRLIGQPRDLVTHLRALERTAEALEKQLGRPPREAEIIAAAGLKTNRDPRKVFELRSRKTVSLDERVYPDDSGSCTYADLLRNEDALGPDKVALARDAARARAERIRDVQGLVLDTTLKSHYKDVFLRHHGLAGRSATDFPTLARERGVSKQCIHQYVSKMWRAIGSRSSIRSSQELRSEIETVRRLGELAGMPIAV